MKTRVVGALIFLIVAYAAKGISQDMISSNTMEIPPDRMMSWAGTAGLDPVGGIPNYTSVTCTGLHGDGSIDDAATINACIAQAAPNTAVYIPAGVYMINSQINMKSGVVLRGAGADFPWLPAASPGSTQLNLSAPIVFDGGFKETNWSPGASQGTPVTNGYVTGSTTITVLDASGYNIGDVISLFQDNDSAVVDTKNLGWLGEDDGTGQRVLQQYSTITGKNGNVLTINPPLSYASPNPVLPAIRKQTFNVTMAGIENLKLNRMPNTGVYLIFARFVKDCWIKNVETYNSGNMGGGSPHVWVVFSYQVEIRDSYFHYGESYDSGRSYGLEFYCWNSSHKIENNIIRDVRHSIVFEGGANCAILYNYTDDNGESVQGQGTVRDTTFLSEDAVSNHGSHPHMNLWEGNHVTSWWGDYTQGSSSHVSLFRNYVRGKNSTISLIAHPWLWSCIEIETYNLYYNLIGNVIGQPSWITGTVVNNGNGGSMVYPNVFRFGYSSAGGGYTDTLPYSTAIIHGNYDYVTKGVRDWASSDHVIVNSLYYASKPGWFGNIQWPPIGPDVTGGDADPVSSGGAGHVFKIPAQFRFEALQPSGVVSSTKDNLPISFELWQNYPNPFNPSTTISFILPSTSFVSLKIFDLLGREVAVLVSKELSAGRYSWQWNAEKMSSGIYFYRIIARSFTETKKLVLLR